MSKKKREAEAKAQAELMAQEEAARAQAEAEARQTKTVRRPTVSFRVMNNCNPVPVAKPADFIQLTPIVQPVPIVPYSSQLQPLAQFDEDDDY